MKRLIIIFLYICLWTSAFSDEGMWLPLHIQRLNQVDMEKMGLQLTAEEIYSVNNSSLKDAIVNLGGGFCTGEIISNQGLLLTNHHCGYDYIQGHSTIENDILTHGFWARNKEEELPNEGLFVQFLVRIEDVTRDVLKGVKDKMSEKEREEIINRQISEIKADAKGDTHYDVKVKSFYEGNEFYLFVYETYHDVRLVGTPPESIGKYGGDTDNWMWPRHTGDFSLFRVYSGPDGKPAEYSENNIPLKPKHYLPISLDGVQENDFAMVFGYPGSTKRYLTSFGVEHAIEETNPARVKIRGKKLEIMKASMDTDPAVRLAYASKYAGVSNYWKYFIGQTKGLKNLNVHAKKVQIEKEISSWISQKNSRIKKYGDPVGDIKSAYTDVEKYNLPFYYHLEAGFGIEFVKAGYKFNDLIKTLKDPGKEDTEIESSILDFRNRSESFFKDYNPEIDRNVFIAMMEFFIDDIDNEFVPEALKVVSKPTECEIAFDGFQASKDKDFSSFADYIFSNSILVNKKKLSDFYKSPNVEKLENDPGYIVAKSVYDSYRNISSKRGGALSKLDKGRRNFIAALRKMNSDKKYYPDANSTLRLTYGKVLSYNARDAVHYHYLTTLKGVMEKEDPTNPEFIVHPKLKELYRAKDYGQYGTDGVLYVGFLTNNDITGGNSGSPVINGSGQLIGTAFDGNWEAMSGDIAFEPELQRCINVDIRYTLFIIDKFAGATHLIDEMTIIKNGTKLTKGNS
ncbi:MAG: S46 family peptidase [Cytophagales bacterium]|nr:S46 family peptidase [Cytophagales bacterium]